MDFKPTIFIGSSKEGLPVANALAAKLKGTSEIQLWPDIFQLNKSNFDNLASQIAFYDYAILVATADDITESRKKSTSSPRDNVVFEFGLFTGGLGTSRVFFLMEDDNKMPSDLGGITLPFIPKFSAPEFKTKLTAATKQLKEHIANKEKTFDLGFLPSTALAYGYFTNFVERTVERLLEDKQDKKEFELSNGSKFKITSLRFTILIPDDLRDDMFKKVKAKRLKSEWLKLKVDPKDVRDYDFSIDVSKTSTGELHLVDIPFTLNALNKSIQLYSKVEHIGKSVRETILEQREIRNFKRTLEYLISTSAIAKGVVDIEIVDI
ncbi:STING domain-containing protein [Pedobacter frigoris]|uniref:STING domain-containing protein n=1 Tax=Pedobacter frigoris TaxID=2571272 RepID=UPI00292CEDFB|nr:STING domain-containing protein [Pedobacter frigoris]